MRSLLVALLIALLPLRGWVGDAMASDMALHMPPQLAAMHPDCAMHGNNPEEAAAQDDGTDQAGGTCSACQVCHSVGIETRAVTLALLSLPRAMLPVLASRFASADRALNAKPPIA